MNKIKTVDGFTFPLTFTDTAGYLYEAYHDEKGFWFKAVESGNIYYEHRGDFDVFKHYIDTNDWNIVSESTQTDPLVTIKQSEYDDLISEINALQELVKELSAPQDTALEQQAETYRALNDVMTTHESFQEGEDGEFTSRCEELLNTVKFLHEVYSEWKTKDYQTSTAMVGNNAFKPISEYTLEDWKQACVEDWEFECRDGTTVQIIEVVSEDTAYPLKGTDSLSRDTKGFWCTGRTDAADIIKRIL